MALCAVAAPTGAEERRAAEVAGRLAALGLEPRGDDAGNVLVRFGGDAPAAVVSAHLDTVFPEDVPLRPARDGDTLRGPGIGDDTVAVATLLQVAALLRDDPPRAPVVVAFTVGEEGLGDLRGIRAVLRSTPARALVAVEGHGLDTLVTGGVASARLRAVYRGPGGHSWADRGRPSAVHVLLAAGAAAVEAARGVHVNIGRAGGGISVNTIASEASLEVDLRDVDDDAVDAAVARVTAALDHAPEGIEARIEQVGRRPGGRLDADDPLRSLVRRARAGAGLPSAAERDASTEANAGYAAGVPSVCVGLTDGGGAHTEDEWIALGPLVRGVDALVRLVYAA